MVSETLKTLYPGQLPNIKLAKSNVRLLAYFVLYMIFLILGAAIFSAIEAPEEIDMIRAVRRRRNNFLKDFPCISALGYNNWDTFRFNCWVVHQGCQDAESRVKMIFHIRLILLYN
ncbi:Potassium channel subfamily K member 1 [Halocaridina rubra]|uniref:Potassium channel subfamily K member 1 n=1 Tax=Halocaridina rubra TaxID=373956 RepID=A0AAN8WFL5_HALRR